tara:strand:+ start:41255 stop:41455 length:201 start_codon:yes stop_codon:yes gene_type:complete
LLFAKQKQTLLATVSLFEEGVREMFAGCFHFAKKIPLLFPNFPSPTLKGGKFWTWLLFSIFIFSPS